MLKATMLKATGLVLEQLDSEHLDGAINNWIREGSTGVSEQLDIRAMGVGSEWTFRATGLRVYETVG